MKENQQESLSRKKIWMKISNDIYELPEAVADSAKELAAICGTTRNAIKCSMSHYRQGRSKKQKYICVEIDDE